ncbi:transglutaminase domain-containing protein [Aquipuribacter sp. MA13-6]|uniref:transglutaminase domain-containing protein n=1 Tax=unclassified Aquipuribacter TaxID=2635084 RepID=UPI003EE9AB2A
MTTNGDAPPPVGPQRYRLDQSFRYDYDAPVLSLLHRLVVVPPRRHGDQHLRLGALQVADPSAQVEWTGDEHGNRVGLVRLAVVPESVHMHVSVVVERGGEVEPLEVGLLGDPRMLEPSLKTGPDRAISRLARELVGREDDALAAADRVCEAVKELVRYEKGTTTVATTAAEALAGGVGVCQDQTHVMLSVLRVAGIPCRYVSGHLVGQGGTHAWVEVLVPHARGARAVAFDPTHARRAHDGYVTVAVGRDYVDVPPTSGWYSGDARGTLSGRRELVREDLPAAAAEAPPEQRRTA